MLLRVALIVMFTVLVGVVGVLISVPFIAGDSLPVVSPGSSASFEYQNDDVSAEVRLQVDTSGRFTVVMDSDIQANSEPPTLVFRMLDHDMLPLKPALQLISNHQLRATGLFPMRGPWQFSLQQGGNQQSFRFLLRG